MRRESYAVAVFLVATILGIGGVFAADISVAPTSGRIEPGDNITVDIRISTPDESINAAQGKLKFDPAILQVKGISKEDSIFSFWLQEPVFSNTSGTIEFIGGTPNGISGGSLKIISITFSGQTVGEGDILFTNASITVADGSGDNVANNSNGARFMITSSVPAPQATPTPTPSFIIPSGQPTPTPISKNRQPVLSTRLPDAPVIAVPLYPDQNVWYNIVSDFSALWSLADDVSDVAVALNRDPNYVVPPALANFKAGCCGMNFPALTEDGIYYVHARFKNNIGWGPTAHYGIKLDTTPPLPFTIDIPSSTSSDEPAPTLLFRTGDTFSGLSSYIIQVGNEAPIIRTPESLMGGVTKNSRANPGTELRIQPTGLGYLNVRSQPTTASSIVGQAQPGDIYTYTDSSNGWYRIVSSDLPTGSGWVLGSYTYTLGSTESNNVTSPPTSTQYRLATHQPGEYPILIRAMDVAGNGIEARTQIEILPIEMPLTTFITDHVILDDGERLTARGTSLPNADVIITIDDGDGLLVSESITNSNDGGEWEFALDRDLRRGTYFVTVRARDARGAESLSTQPIKVLVSDKPLIILFGFGLTLRWLIGILSALLVGFALFYWRSTVSRVLRYQRESIIITRDISNAFKQVYEVLDGISDKFGKIKMTKEQATEFDSSMKRITKQMSTVEKYIGADVKHFK